MNTIQLLDVVALIADLPGCVSTGATRAECETSMHEAIEFHLDGLREEGETVPSPVTSAAFVEVA